MWHWFGWSDLSHAALFQTGWFVESLVTQTLIIHIIRTNRPPLLRSRAGASLSFVTIGVMLTALLLPQSPFAHWLGLSRLPAAYWPMLLLVTVSYLAVTWLVKSALARPRPNAIAHPEPVCASR